MARSVERRESTTSSAVTVPEATSDTRINTVTETNRDTYGRSVDNNRAAGDAVVSREVVTEESITSSPVAHDRQDRYAQRTHRDIWRDERTRAMMDREPVVDQFGHNPAKDLEPQSTVPDRTGVSSTTGIDRSHALFSSPASTFNDPTTQPRVPIYDSVEKIPMDRYGYRQRREFKDDFSDRLMTLDNEIFALKNQAEESSNPVIRQFRPSVDRLESRQEALEHMVGIAAKIPQHDWSKYKSDIRAQILNLERSVDSATAAMR